MKLDIYGYSLCAALALMIFFGVWFIVARKPDKPVFGNYIRSRRIMGAALLVLSANYAVHLLLHPRFTAPDAAILMNLSTYYISAWLFSSALTSLLDNHYIARRKFILHIISWLCFTTTAVAVIVLFPDGKLNSACIIALTLWFLIYAFCLAGRLIREYRKAVRLFDETQSDDIGAYIRWLSVFTWWAVIYGIGCGLFTFIPEKICLHLDTFVHSVLHLPVLFLHELHAFLRESRNGIGDRYAGKQPAEPACILCRIRKTARRMDRQERIHAPRPDHRRPRRDSMYQPHLYCRLHQVRLPCHIPGMDCRLEDRIRQEADVGTSGNDCQRSRRSLRIPVPQLFFQNIHGKGRHHSGKMEIALLSLK